ncbi:MAG: helix-turn-helix transcriptional regulator, partial [Burkholderiales bacterium]
RRRRSTDEPASPGPSDSLNQLSAAELEVLAWVAKGKSNWAIARILSKSEGTVKKQIASAMRKLTVTRRTQIVTALAQIGECVNGPGGPLRETHRSTENDIWPNRSNHSVPDQGDSPGITR